jgi:hypothetical protein
MACQIRDWAQTLVRAKRWATYVQRWQYFESEAIVVLQPNDHATMFFHPPKQPQKAITRRYSWAWRYSTMMCIVPSVVFVPVYAV